MNYDLDPFYLNQRRVALLVGPDALGPVLARRPRGLNEAIDANFIAAAYKSVLDQWLRGVEPTPQAFEVLVATDKLRVGTLFTALDTFYCRDVRALRPRSDQPALLHTSFKGLSAQAEVRLVLRLNREHVLRGSPGDLLQGRVSDLFVVAVVHELLEDEVVAIPIFIGRQQTVDGGLPLWLPAGRCEVAPDEIGSFQLASREPRPSLGDLAALKTVPEVAVKTAFAEIIGEDCIPSDWGGEASDLFTAQLRIEDHRLTAAFVFKGPAAFRPMTMAQLGKNGDQLLRLAGEPADLLVVQHCHRVTPPVRGMLRALCNQVGSTRRFAVIDGYETLRILRAYSKCGFQPSPPSPAETQDV